MNIPVIVKWLTTIAKILGVLSAFDLTPISPSHGVVLALVASTLKDSCNILAAKLTAANIQAAAPVIALVVLVGSAVGCASKIANGNITSVTQSVIGLDLSQDASSAVPHVRIGFVRSQYHVVPTGSNVFAPAVISSIDVESSWNSNAIAEDFATGGATRDLAPDSPAKRAVRNRPQKTNAPPSLVSTNAIPQ